ncbi:MAG: cyclic nucleotide-binding domain-containing protein [Halomonadaceae bacterium]|nr:MAG: cyclic nucleotide-binding domain-containing protein [Halomonadaceae bacterium]
MDTKHIRLLQNVPVFGGITADNLALLLEQGNQQAFHQGEYLFREGDPAQMLYVLESGCVQVLKQRKDQQCLLRRLESGDCLGEMALIDLFPRSASALAETDSNLLSLPPEALMRLYQQDLEQFTLIQMNLARELSRRLRHANEKLFQHYL